MKSKELLENYGKRIVIKPARSRFIVILITALHAAAIVLLFFVDLNAWLLLAVASLVSFHLYRYFITGNLSVYCLSLQQGESMLMKINHGSWYQIDIVESFVTNWLIVLRVRTLNDSRLHSLVYAADSMNSYSFRQLRIYLNHFNVPSLIKS
jgi:predicted neutral ceramidase superfamily lipid hydrolase